MLNNLESIIGEGLKSFSIFAPILALLGGILTSISPCSLASIPLIIGFMTGTKEDDTKRAFKISIVFAIGMAITYTTLGVLAALLSKILSGEISYVGDGLTSIELKFAPECFYDFLNFMVENIAQHHYFCSQKDGWILLIAMEGYVEFGVLDEQTF